MPRLLEDIGWEVAPDVEAEAARLEAWLGPTRVTGSFPTPIEIEARRRA